MATLSLRVVKNQVLAGLEVNCGDSCVLSDNFKFVNGIAAIALDTAGTVGWARLFAMHLKNPYSETIMGIDLDRQAGDGYRLVVNADNGMANGSAPKNNFFGSYYTPLNAFGNPLPGKLFTPNTVRAAEFPITSDRGNATVSQTLADGRVILHSFERSYIRHDTLGLRHSFITVDMQMRADQQGFIIQPSQSGWDQTAIAPSGKVYFATERDGYNSADPTFSIAEIAGGKLEKEYKYAKMSAETSTVPSLGLLDNGNCFMLRNKYIEGTGRPYIETCIHGAAPDSLKCGPAVVTETKVEPVDVYSEPFHWDTTFAVTFMPASLELSTTPIELDWQPLCQTISHCDSVSIMAPDTVCVGQTFTITGRRHGYNCQQEIAPYSLGLTPYEPIGNGSEAGNERSFDGRYTKEGVCYMKVELGNCGISSDFKAIAVVKNMPPVQLPVHDTTLCPGAVLNIAAPPGYQTYSWDNNSPANNNLTINKPGKYIVRVMAYCGGVSSDSVMVRYDTSKLINNYPTAVCKPDTAVININEGFSQIRWAPMANTAFQNIVFKAWPQQSVNYYFEAASQYNCAVYDTVIISVANPATITGLQSSYEICAGDTLNLSVPVNSDLQYRWSDGTNGNTASFFEPGNYFVTATNTANCSTKKDFTVTNLTCAQEVYIPSAFTPDQNGLNDYFGATVLGKPKSFRLTIWNRYGQKVFSTNAASKKWDGSYKGLPATIGNYVWECSYQFANKQVQLQKGTVMLIR